MTSGQRVLIAAFALVVAGGAVLIAGQLSPPPRAKPAAPAPAPPATPPAPNRTVPPPPQTRRWDIRVLDAAGSPERSARMLLPGLQHRRPVAAGPLPGWSAGGFVTAAGGVWMEIPDPDAAGVSSVRVPRAGPAVTITVREADGSPAIDVPCAYGVLGAAGDGFRRTDASGRLVIDDAPSGVLRVRVGSTERAGPLLRLVVGRDREVVAALDPPWVVTGRVVSEDGKPIANAHVRGVDAVGRNGAVAAVGADGGFRWRGRISERTVLVASDRDHATVAVEPNLPAARGALASDVEFRLPADAPVRIPASLPWGTVARLEPAILASARDLFGDADAVSVPLEGGVVNDSLQFNGVLQSFPLRITLRGEIVPEDHIFVPGARQRGLAPQAAAHEPPPIAPTDARATAFLAGKVVDNAGAPLQGVTVDAGDVRATTAADGAFRLEGLVPGRSLDLVYGWIDGADPGAAHPKDFAPSGTATHPPSATAVTLVLRRAAGLTLRVVDGLDDAPLSWARILLSDGEGGVLYDGAVATRDGRVDLEGLALGPGGTIAVLAPGYRREAPLSLRAGASVDVGVLRCTKGAKVVGTVKDARGAAVPGARVALLSEAVLKTGAGARLREHEALLRRATADAKGEVALEGLDPSRAAGFAVWAEGFAPTTVRATAAAPGEPLRFEATLRKGSRVVLRLTDPSNAPISGAVIDLRSALSGALLLDVLHRAAVGTVIGSTEDARIASATLLFEDPATPGLYRVGPVEPGPYELEVQRPGFKPLRWRFSVPDDGDDAPAGAAGASPAGNNPVSRKVFGSIEWPLRLEPLASEGR